MSKPIPVDFTTPASSETPVAPSAGVHCSCGKKLTGECNCDRACASVLCANRNQANVENPTCSCGAHPAGHCDCNHAAVENQSLAGKPTCSCGQRPAGQCTCAHVTPSFLGIRILIISPWWRMLLFLETLVNAEQERLTVCRVLSPLEANNSLLVWSFKRKGENCRDDLSLPRRWWRMRLCSWSVRL